MTARNKKRGGNMKTESAKHGRKSTGNEHLVPLNMNLVEYAIWYIYAKAMTLRQERTKDGALKTWHEHEVGSFTGEGTVRVFRWPGI